MENKYQMSKSTFVPLEKRLIASQRTLSRVLWALFALIWCGVIAFFAISVSNPVVEILLCSLIVAYCLYKVLFSAHVSALLRFFILSKRVGKREWTRRVVFESDKIDVFDDEEQESYKYSQIKEIGQNNGFIALILYNKQCIWLKNDGFGDKTLNDALAFITIKREYESAP